MSAVRGVTWRNGRGLGTKLARRLSTVRADFSLAVIESGLVAGAYGTALVIRSLDPSSAGPTSWWGRFGLALPIIILVHLASNLLFGNYGHVWRYASIDEAVRVVAAAMLAGMALVGLAGAYQLWFSPSALVPLSVLIIGAFLSLAAMGIIRFWSRLISFQRLTAFADGHQRAIIVGVGSDAVRVVRHRSELSRGIDVIGFVDVVERFDMSRVLAGHPVLGGLADVPRLVAELDIDQIIIACHDADKYSRLLVDLCMDVEVRLRILPSIDDVLDPNSAPSDVRDLELSDLLPRQQVTTDLGPVAAFIAGRTVLVTGAGGSIGFEIVQQALSFGAGCVIALDHDETHLHDGSSAWVNSLDDGQRLVSELADIRDRERIFEIFALHSPNIVFHAAAHKHVPILEAVPSEAVKTNIVGTLNVVDAADVCAATDSFVLISTDKAVFPQSVMGSSKRIAELIVQGRAENSQDMNWSAVRFGNVLGSRGSVVPTFTRQVQAGGPVTVSHPDMERYFMSVSEAVELVMQAASSSEGGEIFVLDMGSPVLILDLAHRIIRLAGMVPYKDIDVEITGLRPGERLSEQLAELPLELSAHPQILKARQKAPSQEQLIDLIGYVLALTDMAHPRLGELIVSVANDAGHEVDISELTVANLRVLRPVGRT